MEHAGEVGIEMRKAVEGEHCAHAAAAVLEGMAERNIGAVAASHKYIGAGVRPAVVKLSRAGVVNVFQERVEAFGVVRIVEHSVGAPLCERLSRQVEEKHLNAGELGNDRLEENLHRLKRVEEVVDHDKVEEGRILPPLA